MRRRLALALLLLPLGACPPSQPGDATDTAGTGTSAGATAGASTSGDMSSGTSTTTTTTTTGDVTTTAPATATTADSTSTTGGTTGGTTGAPVDCFDYGAFDGTTPVVGFKADVLPIFQGSCGISPGCHGAGSPDRPYLGPPLSDMATAQNIADIFANTVDFAAFKEPGMSRVAPGDPEHSFLMHKLDGLLKCETLACAADKSCGGPMPEGPKLPDDKLDTIRRWIAQGAKND